MKVAVDQISHAAAFKMTDFKTSGFRHLLNVLLKGKFKVLNNVLVQLAEKIDSNKAHLEEDWINYSQELKSGF